LVAARSAGFGRIGGAALNYVVLPSQEIKLGIPSDAVSGVEDY